MSEPREELERLFEVEYGELAELSIRLTGVFGGSVLLFLYTGWIAGLAWSAVYLVMHAVHFGFLRYRMPRATPADPARAGLLYITLLVSFLWMPAFMAAQADPVLSFVGTVLIATTMAFLIRRAEKLRWLLLLQIGVLAVMWLVISALLSVQLDTMLEQGAVLIASLAACLYISQAMLIARRTRLEAADAAERAMQNQKMSAVGRLAGGVAHDFNNALTVIKGNLELHQEITDPAERAQALSDALAAAERAEKVVQDLMIYARRAQMRRKTIACAEALEKVEARGAPLLPAYLTLAIRKASAPCHVCADDELLASALLHLIRNAANAMPDPGEIELSSLPVTLHRPLPLTDRGRLPAGSYVCFAVTDSGTGIRPEHLRRVLDPFYTTKAIGQGSGLGLAVVSGFVREAGGGLTIDSSDKGTCVRIYLPRVPPPKENDESAETQNAAPEDGVLSFE